MTETKPRDPLTFASSLDRPARFRGARLTGSVLAARLHAVALGGLFFLAGFKDANATNVIRRPGAHNHYYLEVEPHLNLYGYGRNTVNFGPGVRFSIPFMHNGPIDTINNNLAISFGIDTYFPDSGFGVAFPVAAQWNFYFTEIISVLAEAGLVINAGNYAPSFNVLDPYIQGGGRFQFNKVGVLVRVGYPSFSVGANFQF
jgi:hypothetical protein